MGCGGSKASPKAKGVTESKGPAEDKVVVALRSKRRGIFTATAEPADYVKKTYTKSPQARQTIQRALKNHFLFASMRPAEAAEVIDAMQQRIVNAGTVVIKQGEEGDNFYVVERGKFDIYVSSKKVAAVQDGASFGELALLYNSPRAATVAAATSAVLWQLDRGTFRHIIANSSAQQLADCKAALRRVPLLEALSEQETGKVAAAVQLVAFKAGETIIKKGTKGAVFYIIKEGSVRCTNVGAGRKEMEDIVLSAGEYFGERALLTDEPRAANVLAKTNVSLMALDRHDFDSLLGHGHLRSMIDYNMGIRVLQCVSIFRTLSSREREQVFSALQRVNFKPRTSIVKQDQPNSTFYIIKDGTVAVTTDGAPTGELGAGEWFGDEELRSRAPSTRAYTAKDAVECFALEREAFVKLLGPLEKVMNRSARGVSTSFDERKQAGGRGRGTAREEKKEEAATPRREMLKIPFRDLELLATLGTGTFGRVKLARHRGTDSVYALKMLQKAQIVKLRQKANIMNEKNLLMRINHPFILKLYQTYKDRDCLYMLLELVQGGELFNRLQVSGGKVGLREAQFYAACVLDAFDHLHSKFILYRDLKPENLLIDTAGYIKVVDFGFAKLVPDRTYTLCGTPEYLAPELVLGKGHNKGVDYWALGILVYEMVAGYSPFADHENGDQMQICKNILKHRLSFPAFVSDRKIVDVIRRLCEPQEARRLGCGRNGAADIKRHPFFKSVDWAALHAKTLRPAWKPRVKNALDTSNFDDYDERDRIERYHDDGTGWEKTF